MTLMVPHASPCYWRPCRSAEARLPTGTDSARSTALCHAEAVAAPRGLAAGAAATGAVTGCMRGRCSSVKWAN